ncbi:MAG TPA: hypothetical protein PK052_06935 [Anaerohalosphaeraceae bacterium]|nr:hypothetical protein [Phycisphaerae bacterium]HOK95919.1 hypothetical protein [Anaerohalosphaeraceae bacterium]HOL31702.1 hypothetical protein [Anaerohalosphaeraceae bacterium]HOM76377.1 hypothetical protein [Anaerohalosphaeraceae bacterium]HPC64868.1 hypothetical protein [Anaerohalosphaeraceae bacterium]
MHIYQDSQENMPQPFYIKPFEVVPREIELYGTFKVQQTADYFWLAHRRNRGAYRLE